jgi:hypothetical protein
MDRTIPRRHDREMRQNSPGVRDGEDGSSGLTEIDSGDSRGD